MADELKQRKTLLPHSRRLSLNLGTKT